MVAAARYPQPIEWKYLVVFPKRYQRYVSTQQHAVHPADRERVFFFSFELFCPVSTASFLSFPFYFIVGILSCSSLSLSCYYFFIPTRLHEMTAWIILLCRRFATPVATNKPFSMPTASTERTDLYALCHSSVSTRTLCGLIRESPAFDYHRVLDFGLPFRIRAKKPH